MRVFIQHLITDDSCFSSPFQVKIWFQNRRMKWRNSKERELLSSGGSREATIPSKDNPKPDLSDELGLHTTSPIRTESNLINSEMYEPLDLRGSSTHPALIGDMESSKMESEDDEEDDDEESDVDGEEICVSWSRDLSLSKDSIDVILPTELVVFFSFLF